MEVALTVDGYCVSVSYQNGSVVLYVRNRDDHSSIEVAMTPKHASALGFGFLAASEESAQ